MLHRSKEAGGHRNGCSSSEAVAPRRRPRLSLLPRSGSATCQARGVITDATRKLLLWHAGLQGDPLDPSSISGSTAAGHNVAHAVADLLDAMALLNREMNGPEPSQVSGVSDDGVPRSVAYAVSEVVRQLGSSAHVIEAWQIDVAWNAVLAGDIDDLADHIELERRTNPPGPIKPRQ